MSNLCVAKRVDMKQLAKMPTPKPTKTWNPVPHDLLINSIVGQIDKMHDFEIEKMEIGTSHGDKRCFWLFLLKSNSSELCLSIGGRNAHDKAFGIALFGGASVYICSNLQAFAEYALRTKHTSQVMDRLPIMIEDGLKQIHIDGMVNDDRIETYKEFEIPKPAKVNDYLIQSMDRGVIPSDKISKVLDEWRKPRYEEFAPRNMWSFNNCYTEVFKEYNNPEQLNPRSIELTKVMDEWTLFDAKKARVKYAEAA